MAETEKYDFHPEIKDLIGFISGNYKYPKKWAFLYQLISNSTVALDKIQFESQTDKSVLDTKPELSIHVIPNKIEKTLTIVDSGSGITWADLVDNHGTIQWSSPGDVRLYWAYLVAEKVIITTKHNDEEQYVWESKGDGFYTVAKDTSGENLGRGTKVTLFLKEDQLEFLEEHRLKHLIKMHSWSIGYPISLWIEKEIYLVNEQELICKEQFALKQFFVESPLEFIVTLFVPKKAPLDMRNNISVYINGDLFVENCGKFIPTYLDFVKGIVDIQDPPPNMLQQKYKFIKIVGEILVEKSFELFNEIAKNKEDYNKFYEAFSSKLKIGILRDPKSKVKIFELLRYYSTKSGGEMTSMKEYVSRMKEGQNEIYYIIGKTKEAVENSPILEEFKEKGYEVVFMANDVVLELKEFEFEGKKFVCLKKDESKDEVRKTHYRDYQVVPFRNCMRSQTAKCWKCCNSVIFCDERYCSLGYHHKGCHHGLLHQDYPKCFTPYISGKGCHHGFLHRDYPYISGKGCHHGFLHRDYPYISGRGNTLKKMMFNN